MSIAWHESQLTKKEKRQKRKEYWVLHVPITYPYLIKHDILIFYDFNQLPYMAQKNRY